ncbi:DNA replication ATP-dependent helicase/nuclease JHS1 [Citrus sinensis]|uniref:DNA replication ATP-dependent helicase/nuclease JHS1 n=1 Tax=Citrus sinensis TaxID=2711 RepID=A0ACB8MT69_CITSI|nr:DNA replication ATP-dependent helicase/nuclease JHS1 [Citrus sinensis]
MPQRKKANSSRKLQSSQPQPTKFGIQHFFDRHTQNSSKNVDVSSFPQNPNSDLIHSVSSPNCPPFSVYRNPSDSAPSKKNSPHSALENTPPDNILPIDDETNSTHHSPEISKRFKFSPEMLIKLSQYDGGDEVTWNISPVNERLLAVSKQMPPENIRSKQPSPSPKAINRSLTTGRKRVNPCEDANLDGNGNNANYSVSSQQSPFRTPPSLSYYHDKLANGVACNGASDHLGLRHTKKAFLELLDQVKDAISVDASVSSDKEAYLSKSQDKNGAGMLLEANSVVNGVPTDPPENVNGTSSCHFLVSEKNRPADPVDAKSPYKVLRLLNEQSGEERAVHLWEDWFHTVIAPGDTVNVIGEFDDQGKCDVGRENNFLIVHPDVLVSGTRVAASFSCPRRSVLDERLKCSERSISALLGTLLHQIFQAGLMKEIPTMKFLEEYARLVLQKNIESLYACGVNENDIHKTLVEAIPKMLNWIILFKDSQDLNTPTVDFGSDGLKKLKISEVTDIEEMAWAPKYGLKGMIDASIRVKIESKRNEINGMILPLEFKTGKIPNGQASIWYLKHIDSGLLYYLQSDQTQAYGGNKECSGLGNMFDSHIYHLTTAHCSFLRHWDRLIDLEAKEMQVVKNEIWCSRGSGGNHFTGCLSSIVLDASNEHQKSYRDNRFVYHFVRQHMPSPNLNASDGDSLIGAAIPTKDMDCTLRSGDYVILSTESDRLAVASGLITEISRFHVSVSFSKPLRLPGRNSSSDADSLLHEVWRIDKDEIMTSFSVMRYNLVQLFLQSAQSSQLRRMIVDLEAPRFDSGSVFSQDPALSYIWSEKSLNDDQRRAIIKVLTAKDYALILGMPGTGKTSTMVHAVKALLMRGASILLTSYTNSAVDNLLIKLKSQSIDFVRIGRHEVVHKEIQKHCLSAMNINSVEEIKKRLDQVKVVAVTCLGITNPLLTDKKFDVCIMDEAGQTTLPVSLGPLMFASKFVLVGDHYQLPPLVQSTEARENGMEISLFRRLSEEHPQAISALQSQYRMCQGIMELSNALIYGDRLSCGSDEIANAKIKVSDLSSCSPWLKEALNPCRPVIFVNTDMLPAYEAKDHQTLNNPVEACLIAKITQELVKNEIEGKDIGIITPYNSQANLIRHSLSVSSVEIHTIDKYQGRDKDCILVSFVRSSENPRNCTSSLLGDWHRINVALTRAKKKLIMVGSCRTLSKVPLLKLLINKVGEQSGQLTSYTNQLLAHAKQLFQFARNYPGLHQNSIPVIDKFYSSTRYEDELLLATAWLHRATNDQTYLNYLVSTGKTGGTRSLFAWDDKYVGAQVLAGRLVFEGQGLSGDDDNNNNNKSSTGASSRSSSTGTLLLPQYKSQAEQFICLCVQEGNNNNNLKKTPGGLLWFQPWIKLQYAATATFVVTVCSNYLTAAHASIQCSGGLVQPSDLMDLARSQADYILRKNPKEMSYTVGFGANYPTQPNHRGASIVSIKTDRIAPQWHVKEASICGSIARHQTRMCWMEQSSEAQMKTMDIPTLEATFNLLSHAIYCYTSTSTPSL